MNRAWADQNKEMQSLLKKGVFGSDSQVDSSVGIIKVNNLNGVEYDKSFELGGKFVLVSANEYSIIDVKKDGDKLSYTFIEYSDNVDLSKDALKAIVGKEQKKLSPVEGTINKNN